MGRDNIETEDQMKTQQPCIHYGLLGHISALFPVDIRPLKKRKKCTKENVNPAPMNQDL